MNNDFLLKYTRDDYVTYNASTFKLTKKIKEFLQSKNVLIKDKSVDNICFFDDAIIEPFACFYVGNTMQTMGAFSFSNSKIPYGVSIGRYCSIGKNLKIIGPEHFLHWISTSTRLVSEEHQNDFSREEVLRMANMHKINIGHDVWIGTNVSIKRNINIATGSVIGYGAVVTKDTEPFSINVGVPAKKIGYRFEKCIIEKIDKLQWWRYSSNDLKNMCSNRPELFLNLLDAKIKDNKIMEYDPAYITLNDIKLLTIWYKDYIININKLYNNLYFSNNYSKNYFQIYITGVTEKIHYELLNKNDNIFLCLDFEDEKFLVSDSMNLIKKISDLYSSSRVIFSNKKYSVMIPVNKNNFVAKFSKLYKETIYSIQQYI